MQMLWFKRENDPAKSFFRFLRFFKKSNATRHYPAVLPHRQKNTSQRGGPLDSVS
jgi:hypothetical protein